MYKISGTNKYTRDKIYYGHWSVSRLIDFWNDDYTDKSKPILFNTKAEAEFVMQSLDSEFELYVEEVVP